MNMGYIDFYIAFHTKISLERNEKLRSNQISLERCVTVIWITLDSLQANGNIVPHFVHGKSRVKEKMVSNCME
jgi:hypothetical protein